MSRALQRSHLLQIDSVNVLVRAHYMPLFSRLGAYDRGLLEKTAYHPKKREAFEYWGHEASLIRLDLQPLFRWRMEREQGSKAKVEPGRRTQAALDLPAAWRMIGYFCLGHPQAESGVPELERLGWESRRPASEFMLQR